MKSCAFRFLILSGVLLSAAPRADAQATDLLVYTDALTNNFDDWSWASHNLNNSSPVHSGTKSISVTSAAWQAISFHHADIDGSRYSDFSFWVNGGSGGGQKLQVYVEYGPNTAPAYTIPGSLVANAWQKFTIPLSSLGIAAVPNINRITIQLRGDGTTGTFYVDDIQFAAKPIPAFVHVGINANQILQTVDQRHFGVNLAVWDNNYDPPNDTTTTALLKEMGATLVRMPGGSLSDEYHWASNKTLNNTWEWAASFADMVHVITNVGGVQAIITVNYGTGTPQEAAGWVRHANITNNLGYKYWEIGNECYGTWETDTNINPHDAYTYALRASNYLAQMRAADPTIKIGVVVTPGETANANGYTNYPAYNARTGMTNYGWTPVLLTKLKSMGVKPDFLIHHVYPQWTDPNNPSASPDNDNALLSMANWAADAADLRQQISDYYGSSGSNIELVVTENNSDAGAQGKQSTSLVDGLYYADSLSQLLKTEFKGFVWWDLRNGSDNGGFFGSNLYGWRPYGDLGMINGLNTRHPSFYAAKLMQWFARPGDKILSATNDFGWLSTSAARRANGAMTLLVLNKSLITNLNAQVTLNGFVPDATAMIRSFGIPNDEAARTNGPATEKDITTNNLAGAGATFTYNFPALSMTLLSLSPEAPQLTALPITPAGEFVFQLQGQSSVPYVLQASTDLMVWQSVSTNTLVGPTLTITNAPPFDSDFKFWRAVWLP
jgi:alpha-N-arabinofuranosidase